VSAHTKRADLTDVADDHNKIAALPNESLYMSKPVLNYFSICGRGEVARLIAAAGEVEFEDKAWAPAFDESGGWRQGYKPIGEGFGFPGVLPILEHGELKCAPAKGLECCGTCLQ
jgi:hypothetical protein